jgi:hypothetical protein
MTPDPAFDARRGGREDEPEAGSLHPALLTIMQLDADPEQTVDPPLAAKICGYDRDLVLVLINQCSWQEIAWRSHYEEVLGEGDTEEAAAAAHELRAWEDTTLLLRRALRVIVERDDPAVPPVRRWDADAGPRLDPAGGPAEDDTEPTPEDPAFIDWLIDGPPDEGEAE